MDTAFCCQRKTLFFLRRQLYKPSPAGVRAVMKLPDNLAGRGFGRSAPNQLVTPAQALCSAWRMPDGFNYFAVPPAWPWQR